MNALFQNQIKTLIRAYWQHTVLAMLGLLVLGQLVSWGFTFLDLMKIDAQIAQAQQRGSDDGLNNSEAKASPRDDGEKRDERKPAHNIFKRERIPYQLTAIYMDTAIVDNQEVKKGERVGKAKVVEIGPDYVVIQEDDKESPRKLELFKSLGGESMQPGNSRPGAPPSRSRPPQTPPNRDGAPSATSGGTPEDGQAQRGGGALSVQTITREDMATMSPKQRREFFQNLSPDEREALIQRMRR